jgi:hypothetical protein
VQPIRHADVVVVFNDEKTYLSAASIRFAQAASRL